ncbi:N1221-domain-containing protein [Lindgomyces ingoldianus]|uniref:N1221-domain-containing protein n=1 Tax=Lindgomyces ingoldianus TaxID=673940 RepID=A0ACB6QZ75_9PLEO|nr:N1221-domain-containing protein [Lindgomyces ingoldianus]KAF2471365.1 N1221-domain-containing protein [Lindgomyces ingoldianus]
MEPNNLPEEPLVPPVIDEAELIGLSNTHTPVIEAEPAGHPNPPLDTAEQQGLLLDDGANPPPRQDGTGMSLPVRPGLHRDNSLSNPAPVHLPPPAPPVPTQDGGQPTDSLSLMQLRKLVNDLPRVEPTPYSFAYDDASSFEDELEEWFSYSVEEQAMMLKTQASFAQEWSRYKGPMFVNGSPYEEGEIDWAKASGEQQNEFLKSLLDGVKQADAPGRLKRLEALLYILLGCWHESAGIPSANTDDGLTSQENSSSKGAPAESGYEKSALQTQFIRNNAKLLLECAGLQTIVDSMRSACLRTCGVDVRPGAPRDSKEAERREVWCTMTAVYVILEVARIEEKENDDLSVRGAVLSHDKPGIIMILVEIISKLRWDESINLPLSKVCLLVWKAILVCFGGLSQVEKAKDSFKDKSLESADARGQPIITASPLDYHLFRQEISSKYPAYSPPLPLFPLEPENNSILPPLKNHPNKVAGNHVFGSGLGNMNGNNTSIFHQPVHIATPAPSPPPSPAGPGGKGGKKQNYQTNQLFPFLYPPLDESSNNLGGKGSTDLQDLLVGRKWEGADIPASILEAAELFSKRMRATRAMKQLWEERVQFMKYERGWSGADENGDVEDLSLEPKEGSPERKQHPAGSIEERLDLVEDCYRTALPNLQSIVIVLIKAVLSHVTALVTQANGSNGLQSGFQFQENQNGTSGAKSDTNGVNGYHGSVATNEEVDAMRTQEILDKAVSGVLILLLKWFKVSHILKYEYLTQLLVDSSYVPLILKLLQLQEIEKVVNFKCEQKELNFFHFCRAHSRLGIEEERPSNKGDTDSDSDDAVPPPIRLRRDESINPEADTEPSALPQAPQPPEVDELGFPTNEVPKEPITNFSWRAFFTSINYLRIMQKICKNKAHRNLMLVSYKSSQFLRKSLKVPQPELRLYTLKLFKNQVPYCGRKWRQSNMRVITAVYLHCRPELRDDWLAGSDVDAEVDESVPLEQALRALTHWHNLKRYPEGMGARSGVLDEEQDFFRRELEKMDWGEEVNDAESEQQGWDMQVEGW